MINGISEGDFEILKAMYERGNYIYNVFENDLYLGCEEIPINTKEPHKIAKRLIAKQFELNSIKGLKAERWELSKGGQVWLN